MSSDIEIKLNKITLKGNYYESPNSKKLVIFSHGSGSSRLSPRNSAVAKFLSENGISAFLFDLLTEEEDLVYENRFDIELITKRLVEVTIWLQDHSFSKDKVFGYFGASTGAASALKASIELKNEIKAVVSRGGRPDLAFEDLTKVEAPTLLIVGGDDFGVIELNEKALKKLNCIKEIAIISGATHLFEEPGKMDEVCNLALNWFNTYLK